MKKLFPLYMIGLTACAVFATWAFAQQASMDKIIAKGSCSRDLRAAFAAGNTRAECNGPFGSRVV